MSVQIVERILTVEEATAVLAAANQAVKDKQARIVALESQIADLNSTAQAAPDGSQKRDKADHDAFIAQRQLDRAHTDLTALQDAVSHAEMLVIEARYLDAERQARSAYTVWQGAVEGLSDLEAQRVALDAKIEAFKRDTVGAAEQTISEWRRQVQWQAQYYKQAGGSEIDLTQRVHQQLAEER